MSFDLVFTIAIVLFLWILERYFPRKKSKMFDRESCEDIFWGILNKIFVVLALPSFTLAAFSYYSTKLVRPFQIDKTSVGFQLLILLIATDAISYILHRTFHSNRFFWEIHKLHHSSVRLSVFSSFRTSWIEIVFISNINAATASFLGADRSAVYYSGLIFTLMCAIQHSNLHIKYPYPFTNVFISPHNHLWHHASYSPLKNGQNFGFVLTIWDRLFSTYYCPLGGPVRLGLEDKDFPKTIFRKLVYPFWFLLTFLFSGLFRRFERS